MFSLTLCFLMCFLIFHWILNLTLQCLLVIKFVFFLFPSENLVSLHFSWILSVLNCQLLLETKPPNISCSGRPFENLL
jgi:hypothetical protein